MAEGYVQKLDFAVEGQPADSFAVSRMSGREAISEPFRFEVELVSDDPDVALEALAGKDATLTVTRLGETRRIHGMLESAELVASTPQSQYVYRAVLVPRLQRLELTRQNQIHGTTAPVSVREVLNDELSASSLKGGPASAVSGRLGMSDFELRLTHGYPKRDYIVQYDESDLAFISRLCEHYGIFYFFTHDSGRDVVVFGDSRVAFPQAGGTGSVAYRPASGLTDGSAANVFRFTGRSTLVPAQVCLRDYNYRNPTLSLEIDETVDPDGHGVVVEYGAHFRTPQEGRDLARVRAQELLCRKRVFEGASDSVHMMAGAVFDLTDHFRGAYNAGYLLTRVEHEATQALPGLAEFAGPDHQTSYRNRFECLPKTVEFRPARRTPKPRMAGLSNAVVDAAGSGQRAEVDATGRYKIRQQFDQRGEGDGEASRYMRKAEPYGGANTGMHFPLLKGTEVILACVNGDPDRPIIVGAMQNEQYPSVVNARSSTKNRMRTTGGTLFEIDDGPASSGGGSAASSGAALAPQRALEGPRPAEPAPAAPVPLAGQRAEADIQTSGGSSSSYARLQVTSGTDSYWRLGSKPSDSTEDSRTPGMSDMAGGGDAGGAGIFEYSAGDRSSLIDGSSYSQVGADRLDYVVGKRRMSAASHNGVAKGEYQVIANGISIEAASAEPGDNSSPATPAAAGEIMVVAGDGITMTAGGDINQNVGGSINSNVTEDSITKTEGMEVSQTWGATAEFMMGSAISMTFGLQLEINLSVAITIVAGAKVDLFLGIALDVRVGPAFEWASSAAVDLAATSADTSGASVTANGAAATTNGVAANAAGAQVNTAPVAANVGAVTANTGVVANTP